MPIQGLFIKQQVTSHMEGKMSNVHKFAAFCAKNTDAPYVVKEKVWSAALNSSILYGCESWLMNSLSPVTQPYMKTLKLLLGVRPQTSNLLVHIESGAEPVSTRIRRQQTFFFKKIMQMGYYAQSSLHKSITLTKQAKTPMGTYFIALERADFTVPN
jgi:hypothetical protein